MSADLRFLGERPDATRLMQAADFLVLPSHKEGLSNAVLEAMAAGCPVIASAVGGTPELLDHDCTGLLFPTDDHVALGSGLARLADAGLRARLSINALDHVTRSHSVAALVTATVAVYERSLAQAAGNADRKGSRSTTENVVRRT